MHRNYAVAQGRLTRIVSAVLAIGAGTIFASSCSRASDALSEADASRDVITLQRSACYGSCPDYKVTIFGNGRVLFTSNTQPLDLVSGLHRQFAMSQGVLLPGTHEDRIAPETVAALIAKFRSANFFRLRDQYRAGVTDNPTYMLTVETPQGKKSVEDYVGREVGMPKEVTELEDAVDKAAGTDRWVQGNAALVTWLDKQKFDFHSSQATELLANGTSGRADEAFALGLIAKGVRLDADVTEGSAFGVGESKLHQSVAGQILMRAAVSRGFAGLFKSLVASGWLERLGKHRISQEFANDAAGCSPALVDAAVGAGINIDEPIMPDPQDDRSYEGMTALSRLADSYRCEAGEGMRVVTAGRLLAHGANPNHRNSLGQTSIYGVENIELLNLLLSHGADASVKDNAGLSMIFGTWTDDIVVRLLEAGASPQGHYEDGNKTLPEMAQTRDMPKVLHWLAAHPEAMKR